MERYMDVVDDPDAFAAAHGTDALPALRRNPLKAGDGFDAAVREEFDAERADWNQDVYRVETDAPGATVLHWRGDYYVQEASAAVPVMVLDPRPGEAVLDMAAAPGGKTTQIAGRMENTGTVVANDVDEGRLWGLQANLYRFGAANVATVNRDATHLPEDRGFDRVLLDAPCTGEGNRFRKGEEAADPGQRAGLVDMQERMIEKAARLLAEDGTLLYSTCTFAPEENEGVVAHALAETGLSLERVDLDLPHARGLTSFRDETYGDEMERTVRIYPHHLDSGGAYVARFTR